MIFDRLLVAAGCCWLGVAGLLPADPPKPLTPAQLQVKAKQKSISNVCDRKSKSKEVQKMCKRWRDQQNA